jgi:hypothetical protein
MIKILLFLKKKPGMSRDAFIDYYENHHVPLILGYTGEHMALYKRSFIDWSDPLSAASAAFFGADKDDATFDVVTEVQCADRDTLMTMFGIAQQPDIAAAIAADEENLFDRAASKMVIVDERGG